MRGMDRIIRREMGRLGNSRICSSDYILIGPSTILYLDK